MRLKIIVIFLSVSVLWGYFRFNFVAWWCCNVGLCNLGRVEYYWHD